MKVNMIHAEKEHQNYKKSVFSRCSGITFNNKFKTAWSSSAFFATKISYKDDDDDDD